MSEREEERAESHEPKPTSLAALYAAIETPHIVPSSNPEDPRLQNRINRFFETVLSPFQLNDLMREAYVEITKATIPTGKDMSSYDEYQTLSLRDLQPLAAVIKRVHNGVVYSAFAEKVDLEAATIEAVKGYHEGDTFITDILFRR